MEAFLPYIERDVCLNISSHWFGEYLIKEKFCAGSLSGITNYNLLFIFLFQFFSQIYLFYILYFICVY